MFSVCVLMAANNILSDTLGQNSKSGTKARTNTDQRPLSLKTTLHQQTLFCLFN